MEINKLEFLKRIQSFLKEDFYCNYGQIIVGGFRAHFDSSNSFWGTVYLFAHPCFCLSSFSHSPISSGSLPYLHLFSFSLLLFPLSLHSLFYVKYKLFIAHYTISFPLLPFYSLNIYY